MKLLRTNVRIDPKDSLGQGLDATFTLVLFFGLGFFLDRWLGTTPWFMIGLSLAAAIGLFYRLRNGYEAKMQGYDAEFAARRAARGAPQPPAAGADATAVPTDGGPDR